MKKVLLLTILLVIVVSIGGCQTAKQTTNRNLHYLADDGVRALGLEESSGLHRRDLEPWDAYEPYRGYP